MTSGDFLSNPHDAVGRHGGTQNDRWELLAAARITQWSDMAALRMTAGGPAYIWSCSWLEAFLDTPFAVLYTMRTHSGRGVGPPRSA
jgi:hypothetical protein